MAETVPFVAAFKLEGSKKGPKPRWLVACGPMLYRFKDPKDGVSHSPCSRHGLSSSLMARITSNGNTGRPTAAVAYNLGLWLDQEHLDALPLAGATVSSTVSDETGARR